MTWPHLRRSTPPTDGTDAESVASPYLEEAARALSPEPERLERVRAAVIAEYRAATARDATSSERIEPGRGRFWMPAPRAATALAIGLAFSVGSLSLVAAGSTPGRPFYGLRLAFESLTLPASATPARLEAQLVRLDRRLAEAGQATLEGDAGAASDAIAAYRAELGDASAEVGREGADVPRLGQALTQHAVLLARLGSELSGMAKTATADALDQVNRLRRTMQSAPGQQRPGSGPGGVPNDHPGGTPGNGNGGGNGGGNNGGGNNGGGNNGGGNNGNGNGNNGNNGNGGGNGPGRTPAH